MSNTIRIKRRASGGGNAAGAPTSLKNGELAYNEVDDILYYGKGLSGGNAATIPGIAGSGAYVNKSTAQTVGGIKTFTELLKPDGGINVNSGKFTVATNGNVFSDGSLEAAGSTFVVSSTGVITSGEWNASTIAAAYIGSLPASKITSGTIPIARGGTGATSATAAASALGLGTTNDVSFANVTATGSGGFSGSGANLTGLPAGQLTGNIDTARLPVATATERGAIELFSGTAQSVAANTVTTTASRTYGIQLNSDGQAVVNVPWENDNTQLTTAQVRSKISGTGLISYNDSTGVISTTANNYSLPEATATVRGGIELFSNDEQSVAANSVTDTASRTYGIQLNSAGQAVVNVPWSDTDTNTQLTDAQVRSKISGTGLISYNDSTGVISTTANNYVLPVATATVKGGIELFSNTAQSVAANAVSTTASRTYGIQLNSAGQAVVNVPWSDTNTNTNTTYDLSVPASSTKIRLAGSDSTNDDVEIAGGSNVTVTRTSGTKLTISSTDTNTFRTVQADGSAIGSGETLNLIGGTNVTLSENNGAITIASTATATKASLGLDGSDDVAFGNLELGSGETSATIKGPATLTIDPSTHGDNTGKVVIAGDLQVDGTTTTVNSTTVEIDDLAIELAHDAGTSALINGAGLRFGTDSSGEAVHDFIYVHADTRMLLSSGLKVTGGLQETTLTSCTIDGGTF